MIYEQTSLWKPYGETDYEGMHCKIPYIFQDKKWR